jgi:hypothetical protein
MIKRQLAFLVLLNLVSIVILLVSRSESVWIDAALDAGVLETEMLLVVHP